MMYRVSQNSVESGESNDFTILHLLRCYSGLGLQKVTRRRPSTDRQQQAAAARLHGHCDLASQRDDDDRKSSRV